MEGGMEDRLVEWWMGDGCQLDAWMVAGCRTRAAGQGEPAFARSCVAARSGETVRTVEP